MGVWVKGPMFAGLLLVGCAPFPGEDGGASNYVSFKAYHGWGTGLTAWSIDENDRITYFTYNDGRLEGTPPKITDMRRAAHVEGAYQAIVDYMNATDFKTLDRFCYTQDDPNYEKIPAPTDSPYSEVKWATDGQEYTASYSLFECEGGNQPEFVTIRNEIITAIKNIVGGALGVNP